MTSTAKDAAVALEERLGRVEDLLRDIDATADAVTRGRARELVAVVLELHKVGLARLLDVVDGAAAACANDELLQSLLLLHDLHPSSLAERARAALVPLQERGVRCALVDVVAGLVRVRVDHELGRVSAGDAVQLVEDAILAAAPDAVALKLEGSAAALASGLIPLLTQGASRTGERAP